MWADRSWCRCHWGRDLGDRELGGPRYATEAIEDHGQWEGHRDQSLSHTQHPDWLICLVKRAYIRVGKMELFPTPP